MQPTCTGLAHTCRAAPLRPSVCAACRVRRTLRRTWGATPLALFCTTAHLAGLLRFVHVTACLPAEMAAVLSCVGVCGVLLLLCWRRARTAGAVEYHRSSFRCSQAQCELSYSSNPSLHCRRGS